MIFVSVRKACYEVHEALCKNLFVNRCDDFRIAVLQCRYSFVGSSILIEDDLSVGGVGVIATLTVAFDLAGDKVRP